MLKIKKMKAISFLCLFCLVATTSLQSQTPTPFTCSGSDGFGGLGLRRLFGAVDLRAAAVDMPLEKLALVAIEISKRAVSLDDLCGHTVSGNPDVVE